MLSVQGMFRSPIFSLPRSLITEKCRFEQILIDDWWFALRFCVCLDEGHSLFRCRRRSVEVVCAGDREGQSRRIRSWTAFDLDPPPGKRNREGLIRGFAGREWIKVCSWIGFSRARAHRRCAGWRRSGPREIVCRDSPYGLRGPGDGRVRAPWESGNSRRGGRLTWSG